ncbi:helix-turn-helix domain-containing protein [Neomoorella mulderi]|uniref:HTH-type transcriptional regulator Xre n=1 Tax=Moorella mulderi DSM 14980 TaxID=1122241 RepID=A0A151AWA3_9FIRM|nr:helix-turn-helix transcriptional regulator [Moorella mulderi]KYH31891.1 HTH-type transcriptional regulator Xre [Moorella mulderi DSM 14980]
MATFGERLKSLREQKELSQEALGKKFHLSQSIIAHYEAGRKQPSQDILQRLADFFNVSVDFLLGRTDDPNPGQHRSTIEEDWPEVTDVLRRCGKKPTPEERRRIARIIKAAIEDTDDI